MAECQTAKQQDVVGSNPGVDRVWPKIESDGQWWSL